MNEIKKGKRILFMISVIIGSVVFVFFTYIVYGDETTSFMIVLNAVFGVLLVLFLGGFPSDTIFDALQEIEDLRNDRKKKIKDSNADSRF